MPKKSQNICFIGSRTKLYVNINALRQELFDIVKGIKTVIFPNKKNWTGYAFIMFDSKASLNAFLSLKTVKLSKCGIELFVKRQTLDKKFEKARIRDKNMRMILSRNIPPYFN